MSICAISMPSLTQEITTGRIIVTRNVKGGAVRVRRNYQGGARSIIAILAKIDLYRAFKDKTSSNGLLKIKFEQK